MFSATTPPRLVAMFFRRKKSASGQTLQLLEAYRNAHGEPRHRVVVSLEDSRLASAHRPAMAEAVANRLLGQAGLLPLGLPPRERRQVDAIVKRVDREGRWRPGIRRGLEEAKAGKGRPIREAIETIRKKHRIPRAS